MRTILRFLLVTLLLPGVPSAATNEVKLPDMGASAQSYLSTEQERRLGEAFMRHIRKTLPLVDDPEVADYIQHLGYRLVANSDFRDQKFTFFVVKSPVINAFAGPGGHIGVNSGLLLLTHSEPELASVMAHEIAHVTQRHIARAVEAASKMQLPMAAALAAALILGSQDAQLGTAALAAAAAGSVQKQINFTRSNEEEADRIGLKILAGSGYDPRSMPLFFERMLKASGTPENPLYEFLRTHPMTSARIADTRNRAEQYPRHRFKDNLNFALVKAKLEVFGAQNPAKALATFKARLKNPEDMPPLAVRYGYGLALLRNGDLKEARKTATELLDAQADKIAFHIFMAEVDLASGKAAAALRRYKKQLDINPYNQPLTLLYAKALIDNGQGREAASLLNGYLRKHHQAPPLFYSLLAQAENATGNKISAHQALAEYYFLNGQTGSAINQLRIALDAARDANPIRTARIEARLKKLKELYREEQSSK